MPTIVADLRTRVNVRSAKILVMAKVVDRRVTARVDEPFDGGPILIGSSGDVGIWHETYLVPAGGYECVYNNMPPFGLGEATEIVPAAGRKASAARRAGIRDEPYAPGAPTKRIEI